jgi:hypothetical protein
MTSRSGWNTGLEIGPAQFCAGDESLISSLVTWKRQRRGSTTACRGDFASLETEAEQCSEEFI